MMLARWQIDARFGHKPALIEAIRAWGRDIAPQIGWTADKVRISTGSVGALESTVEVEVQIRDLAELSASWERLGAIAAHKEWSKQIEPVVVSGSPVWKIYRLL